MKKILILIVLVGGAIVLAMTLSKTPVSGVSDEDTPFVPEVETNDVPINDTIVVDDDIILEIGDEEVAVKNEIPVTKSNTHNDNAGVKVTDEPDEDDATVERKFTTEMDNRTIGNESRKLETEYREYRDGTFAEEADKSEEQHATDTLSLENESITRKIQPSSKAAQKTESEYDKFKDVFESEF